MTRTYRCDLVRGPFVLDEAIWQRAVLATRCFCTVSLLTHSQTARAGMKTVDACSQHPDGRLPLGPIPIPSSFQEQLACSNAGYLGGDTQQTQKLTVVHSISHHVCLTPAPPSVTFTACSRSAVQFFGQTCLVPSGIVYVRGCSARAKFTHQYRGRPGPASPSDGSY